jgi:hypothetical protein
MLLNAYRSLFILSEKYLVHEFAKYWYGVFEEYPNPGENQFYFSTTFGRSDPVRCTTGLIGRIVKRTSSGMSLCTYETVDPETGDFPEGCVYYPYPYNNRGTASMMDYSYIKEVNHRQFTGLSGSYPTRHAICVTILSVYCSLRTVHRMSVVYNTMYFVKIYHICTLHCVFCLIYIVCHGC